MQLILCKKCYFKFLVTAHEEMTTVTRTANRGQVPTVQPRTRLAAGLKKLILCRPEKIFDFIRTLIAEKSEVYY
jgi:hypothetical protein